MEVSDLLHDPDFATKYTIVRTQGRWEKGRPVIEKSQRINLFHPVQPATTKDLEQLPEGDRETSILKFFCTKPNTFHLTNDNNEEFEISDIIEYQGNQYKILKVMPWDTYGWQRAFACLIEK